MNRDKKYLIYYIVRRNITSSQGKTGEAEKALLVQLFVFDKEGFEYLPSVL